MARRFVWGAVNLSALCWSGLATAQDSHADSKAEILVTGEKARRSLRNTNSSVAAITSERVAREGMVSIQEAFQRTANVSETFSDGSFTIRGIADRGIKGGEGSALATIFVDGAAIPSALVQAVPTDMWDISQVEILRGPQSTLQGLNTLAGAVMIRTAEPTMAWNVRGRTMITDADETQFAAALGGPIVPGELAFRVAVEKRDADGFIWNPTRQANENPLDSTQVRVKLLWAPRALSGFEARFGYTRYKRRGGYAFSFTDIASPGFFDRRRNFSNDPSDSDADTNIATADLRFDAGAGFSFTAVSAYNLVRERNRYDNDLTAAAGGALRQQNRFRTFSQELRLNYESDRLSGLIGAFAFARRSSVATTSDNQVPTPIDTITALLLGNGVDARTARLVSGLYGEALPRIPVTLSAQSEGRVKTHAVFGDARLSLADRLSLVAGFRYDREVNSLAIAQTTRLTGALPDPRSFGPAGSLLTRAIVAINQGVGGLVAQANGSTVPSERAFATFLPKAGIEMHWTRAIRTAFTVQRGYRSGGTNSNVARSATFSYDPEFTWNYELALRSTWLDGALNIDANAYYVDWKRMQVLANFGLGIYDTHLVNAGRSHLYGFELEMAQHVSPGLDWYASVGHTRTRFDAFATTVGGITDYSGLEFSHAPHWTLSGGINVKPTRRLSIHLNASHRTAVFTDVRVPQAATRAGSRTLLNARFAYEAEHWTLSVFASNILDDHYYHYRLDDLPRAVLGNPRVLGVALEGRW